MGTGWDERVLHTDIKTNGDGTQDTARVMFLVMSQHQFPSDVSVEEPSRLPAVHTYPNPAVQSAYIELPNPDTYRLTAFDAVGRMVYLDRSQATDRLEIDLSDWRPGMYYLLLTDSRGKLYQSRVVKQ